MLFFSVDFKTPISILPGAPGGIQKSVEKVGFWKKSLILRHSHKRSWDETALSLVCGGKANECFSLTFVSSALNYTVSVFP